MTSLRRSSLFRLTLGVALMLAVVVGVAANKTSAAADVTPPVVDEVVPIGTSIDIDKIVGTSPVPPVLDFCLLVDNSGSYNDDLPTIDSLAPGLAADIQASGADVQFCLATFVDFPFSPYGNAAFGDYEYQLDQDLTPSAATWTGAVSAMVTRDGADIPESQYEALSRISVGPGAPSWRAGATRVVAITTDAPFHDSDIEAGYPGVGGVQATADLVGEGITVIAIKAPGSGAEMDAVAAATGGSVQTTGNSSDEIADAVLAGLSAIPTTVVPHVAGCDPLVVSFAPPTDTVNSGDDAHFVETISVPNDPSLEGTTIECAVVFTDEDGNVLGEQVIRITIPDLTAPVCDCIESVNPNGNNVPRAGQKSPGQNEDGYYQLVARDAVDPDPQIFVVDTGSGTVFGPFSSGDVIKYTQANGAEPNSKKIGSDNGNAGAVEAHITGNGDAAVFAVDASGNVSARQFCLVPPPPK